MNRKDLVGVLIVAAVVTAALSPLLVVWPQFLLVGLVALALFIGWCARRSAGWHVAVEEIQRQTDQALDRDEAAYELASERMELLAHMYQRRSE